MFSRWIGAVLGVLLIGTANATACGFIETGRNRTTLRQDAATAQFVLLVRAENARQAPDGSGGTTDLVVLKVLQRHPAIDGRRMIRMDRYLSLNEVNVPTLFVVFGDVVD